MAESTGTTTGTRAMAKKLYGVDFLLEKKGWFSRTNYLRNQVQFLK